MVRLLLAVACVVIFGMHISRAQETECTLAPRLVVSNEGRVLQDIIVNVREEPGLSGEYIGRMPSAGMFTLLDGPRCVDGYQWWQVDYHHAIDPMTGWVAEGDAAAEEYWLEPRGVRGVVTGDDEVERYYVELPDGTTEPEGCLAPPENYERAVVNGEQLNQRTLFMLDHAEQLFTAQGGWIDFRSTVTQGSYSNLVSASFGTHDGGGAVDISVRNTTDWSVRDDVDEMIYALRVAGFAAWLREADVFYPDSPIHIHAIAVGDQELSDAARAQIDGDEGYLRGLDGLPAEYNGPDADPHGGPVICQWMVEAGFDEISEEAAG